jgi:hypothetical protein
MGDLRHDMENASHKGHSYLEGQLKALFLRKAMWKSVHPEHLSIAQTSEILR